MRCIIIVIVIRLDKNKNNHFMRAFYYLLILFNKLLSIQIHNCGEKLGGRLSPPSPWWALPMLLWGGLGVTHAIHRRLIGKMRNGLHISDNWTFYASYYGWGATSGYGMHCLKTLFLRCHCHHFGVDLKPSFSSSHISILLFDCTFGTIVVLEVILVT